MSTISNHIQQLPNREVVATYMKRREIAKALDSVLTVIFSNQPEDPEKYLLEHLANKNPQLVAQIAHQQHGINNNNNNNNGMQHSNTMSRHDSTKLEPAQGDGTAPRQPVPPSSMDTRGVVRRRTSTTTGMQSMNNSITSPPNNNNNHNSSSSSSSPNSNNNNTNGTAAGTTSNLFLNNNGSSTPNSNNNTTTIVPQTNLQAEELLQWILDVTDPSSSAASRASAMQHTNSNSSSNAVSGGDNYTVRVPQGLESHPLASRCRQLASRYYATSRALENAAIEIDAEGNEQPLVSRKNHASSSRKHGSKSNTNSSNENTQSSTGSIPKQERSDLVNNSHNNNNNTSPINTNNDNSNTQGSTINPEHSSSSPSLLSPAVFSHLKTSFNLSDSDHSHLLLAVTDAMRIVLDWAGDALLVAENLARVVKLLVNGERCTVFVADERAQALRTVIDGKQILVKFGQGIVGRCAVHKVPLVVNNAYAHPSFNPSVDGEVNYVTRNVLSMPMIVEGKLIAVVQVLNKKDGDFSEIDVEIFKAFTAVAGIVVRDAMTFPLTMRNLEHAESAKELCTQMMNVNMLNEKQAAEAWAGMLRNYLGSDCCTILRVKYNSNSNNINGGSVETNPLCGDINNNNNTASTTSPTSASTPPIITQDQLELNFIACDSEFDFGGFQPMPQKEIIASVLSNRAPELINDARHDPRFDKQGAKILQNRASTSSLLVVPIFPYGLSDSVYTSTSTSSNVNHPGSAGGTGQQQQYANNTTSSSAAPTGNQNNNSATLPSTSHQSSNRFTCYIVQFENFKETPNEIAVSATNNNNTTNASNDSRDDNFEAMGESSVSSANDIIFSEEAVEHVSRVLPFFETLLRSMNLIHAQRYQAVLLSETAKAISTLCDGSHDPHDAFDMLARSIETTIQRETKKPSVLFYSKVDSEGIECLQLLPRASLAANNNKASSASATGVAGAAHHHQQQNSAAGGNNNTTSSSSTGGGAGNNNNASPAQSKSNAPPQSFRIRRRQSLHLAYNNHFANDIRVPIGSGVVGNAVARMAPAYFTCDEVNELYNEGEFGPLVPSGVDMPNCSCLVVPLAEGKMLLGAMVILRPRDDVRDRVLEVLSGGGSMMDRAAHSGSLASLAGSFNSHSVAGGFQQQHGSSPHQHHRPHPVHIGMIPQLSSLHQLHNITANQDWLTVSCDQLIEPSRMIFLSIITSVAKYVLKASSTVAALARQQESLLFSGELERLAMPTTNQSGKTHRASSANSNNKRPLSPATSNPGDVASPATLLAASGNNLVHPTNTSNNNGAGAGAGAGIEKSSVLINPSNINQFQFGGTKAASPLDVALNPEMFDLLSTTRFPIFDFVDGNQPAMGLVALVVHMFRSLNCLAPLNIDEGILSQAILKSFRRYRDVPYHNVFHAFDVTQSCFLFIKMGKFDDIFQPAERFALLLAAVFHDIDHNGLNNAYHMKAETAFGMIASLSGQKSVLEYHHCQVAIDVINSMQLLRNTHEEDRRRILKTFFQSILSTDMAVHREIMQQIQASFLGEDGVTRCFDSSNAEHRDLAGKMLLKMADISNPVKDFALARRWALSVTEEFYRQGDVERLEGHEVAPMFDRQLNAELSKGQIGFINFMAGPFFNLTAKCFPEFDELTRNMNTNLSRWKKVQDSNVVSTTAEAK